MSLLILGILMIIIFHIAKYLMLDLTRPVVYDILNALQIIGYILGIAGLASFITAWK